MAVRMVSRWHRWGRSDSWFMYAVLALMGVVAPLMLAVPAVVNAIQGGEVTQVVDTGQRLAAPAVPAPGVTVAQTGQVEVVVAHPDSGLRWLAMTDALLTAACVALVCWIIAVLVRAVERGQPFTTATVRGFRRLATLTVAAGVVLPILSGMVVAEVRQAAGLNQATSWTMTWGILPFLVAMLLLLMAEVFARGQRLRDDVDGLV